MPTFEFVLEGPPVALQAQKKNAARYQKWIKTVKREAAKLWPLDSIPISTPVSVTISNYYTKVPPDVDNIIKPILDGMKGLIYEDDSLVQRVTSQKFGVTLARGAGNTDPIVVEGLDKYSELVHIVVDW